jgi:hypothetical protein
VLHLQLRVELKLNDIQIVTQSFFKVLKIWHRFKFTRMGRQENVSKTFKYLTYDFKYNDTILAKSTLYLKVESRGGA